LLEPPGIGFVESAATKAQSEVNKIESIRFMENGGRCLTVSYSAERCRDMSPICDGSGSFGKMDEVEQAIDSRCDHEFVGWAGAGTDTHLSAVQSVGHTITPADSRAALVGRVWPWPARLSAVHRRQVITILTSSVISHPFPALHRLHRSSEERGLSVRSTLPHPQHRTFFPI
jgi:hypothetical protein